MYISLWVLIPMIIVVIFGARESWKNSTELDLLKADKEHDRRALEELREDIREYDREQSRVDAAFDHLWHVAFDGNRDAMLAAVEEAKRFRREEGKSWKDAPWKD